MASKEKYDYVAHSFEMGLRVGGKQYCTTCGLVSLNNEFTAWATRMGCNHRDHPSYSNKLYDLTKLFD